MFILHLADIYDYSSFKHIFLNAVRNSGAGIGNITFC